MGNHPLHPFPYPEPIVVTSITYWQALPIHHLQTTFHKHSTQTIKKACHKIVSYWFWTRTNAVGVRNLTKATFIWFWWYITIRYLLISIDNTISNQPFGPVLQPFTQKLWQRYISMTFGNPSSNQEVRHSPCTFWI